MWRSLDETLYRLFTLVRVYGSTRVRNTYRTRKLPSKIECRKNIETGTGYSMGHEFFLK